MACNLRDRRHGADPPKNESGRNGAVSERDESVRSVSSGNGTCIAVQTFSFSICEVITQLRLIWRMRLLCSSTETTLSIDVSVTSSWMRRGNAGQTSRVFPAGVPVVQKRCRFKRRGDPKTRLLHRRHTCTSGCHHSISLFANGSITIPGKS